MHTSLFKCTILGLALSGTVMAQQSASTSTITVEESQDRHKVITNHFWENWFVGIGGGAQVYFGDNDSKLSFGKRITPSTSFYFGKWFTPGLGVRLGADFAQAKGLTLADQYVAPAEQWYLDFYNNGKTHTIDGVNYNEQEIKYGFFSANAMFNVTNLLCGFKRDRFYNFIPYGGAGLIASKNKNGVHEHELAITAGLLNTFRLGNALHLTLDVKGMLFEKTFSHKHPLHVNTRNGADHIASATLGLVYKFRERDWERPRNTTTVIKYSEEELNLLRERVNALAKANEELTNQLASANSQVRPQIEKEITAMPLLITFPINKSTVSNAARVNLGFLSKVIKENPDISYVITGYADKGTGTPAINRRLSEARANAIYDILTKEHGVNPAQLSTAYEGGVGNMFYDDPRVSRAVITFLKKK